MERDFKQTERKRFNLMRRSKDFTMAGLILAMAVIMLWGDKLGNDRLRDFILEKDPMMRYLFGSLCLIYGSFRLYRGIKMDT